MALAYKVWQERNNALWNMHVHTIDHVIKDIQYIVRKLSDSRLTKKMKDVDMVSWDGLALLF